MLGRSMFCCNGHQRLLFTSVAVEQRAKLQATDTAHQCVRLQSFSRIRATAAMKSTFKTLVRSISPFAKSTPAAASPKASDKGSNRPANRSRERPVDYSTYHWDLSDVDLRIALKQFYKQFNPEKVYAVPDIIKKYSGDEIQLLQQLCERYKLKEHDMQEYLDAASQRDKRSARSVSVGSTTSKQRSEDRDKLTPSGYASQSSGFRVPGTLQRQPSRDMDTGSVHSASSHSVHNAQQRSDWDLSDVDVGKALTLIYREHNPDKSPNLNAIRNKTDAEIVSLLRQLCKRHNLSEKDMQEYLDRANETVSSSVGHNHDSSLATGARPMSLAGSQAAPSSVVRRPSSINAPATAKTHEIFSALRAPHPQSLPPFDDDDLQEQEGGPADADNVNHRSEPQQEQQQYEQYRQQETIGLGRRSSMPPHRPPPIPTADPYPPTASSSGAGTRSQQRVPFSSSTPAFHREDATSASSNTPRSQPPATEEEQDYAMYMASFTDAPPPPPPSTFDSHDFPGADGERIVQLTEEIRQLEDQLRESRSLFSELEKESKALVRAMRDKEREKERRSVGISKAVQADDFSSQAEAQKLRSQLAAEGDRNSQLTATAAEQSKAVTDLTAQVQALTQVGQKLQCDKTDLLQLLDILTAAPVPAKSVLESYLVKVAGEPLPMSASQTARARDKALREKLLDKKQLSMGARIDCLLQWKRSNEMRLQQQQRQDSTGDEDNGDEDAESEEKANRADQSGDQSSDDERFLLRDEATHEDDRGSAENDSRLAQRTQRKNDDELANLLSADERRLYSNLASKTLRPNGPGARANASASASANTSPLRGASASTSSLAAGSSTAASVRSMSPSIQSSEFAKKNTDDQMTNQYELAKKYLSSQRQQASIAEQLAKANLALQESVTDTSKKGLSGTATKTESVGSSVASSTNSLLPKSEPRATAAATIRGASPSPAARSSNNVTTTTVASTASTNAATTSATTASAVAPTDAAAVTVEPVTDWVECFDPRSQRTYYFSAKLKKSTWSRPVDFEGPSKPANTLSSLTAASVESQPSADSAEPVIATNNPLRTVSTTRSASPMVNLRTSSTNNDAKSSRAATTSSRMRAAQSGVGDNNSAGGGASGSGSGSTDLWMTCVDPKSGRTFWHNKETKQSTWRKPAELI